MEKETLYRFYKGEATSDEQRRLMEWLDADQENRRIFDRERGMYNALLLFAPEEKAARGRLLNWRRVTRYAVQAAAVTPAGRSWLRRSPVRLRCSARASTSMLTSGTMYSLRRSCAAASG